MSKISLFLLVIASNSWWLVHTHELFCIPAAIASVAFIVNMVVDFQEEKHNV